MASTVDADRVGEHRDDAETLERKLDTLAEMFRASRYTVFFTGAGVSTSAGIGDYRGPTGSWTVARVKQLEEEKRRGDKSHADELAKLKLEASREVVKSTKKVDMVDAQPTFSHMAMATLIHTGHAHYVVTTNLDGLHRKSGLQGHTQLCCLHGDVYIERCTACGYDFERNFHVRQGKVTYVHDHKVGTCSRCGSATPSNYTGRKTAGVKMTHGAWGGVMIGTCDRNMGTKDTHINFGEQLDPMDWDEAEAHCGRANLCVVAGTSMSLRHITHMPFMAERVVIINLQPTPDDEKCHLRIWATTDAVFTGLMARLGVTCEDPPIWQPRDAIPVNEIPRYVSNNYREAARRLEALTRARLAALNGAPPPSSSATTNTANSTRSPPPAPRAAVPKKATAKAATEPFRRSPPPAALLSKSRSASTSTTTKATTKSSSRSPPTSRSPPAAAPGKGKGGSSPPAAAAAAKAKSRSPSRSPPRASGAAAKK